MNDKTGEKITKLYEKNMINIDEYSNIMDYLSMDIFKNSIMSIHKFIDIFESISIEIKKILLTDFVHKFADMIYLSCFLDKISIKVINDKILLYALIKKIDKAEAYGFEFNRKKLEIIEQQYERV